MSEAPEITSLSKIVTKVLLPTVDFADYKEQNVKVTIEEPDKDRMEAFFCVTIPKHIYEMLRDNHGAYVRDGRGYGDHDRYPNVEWKKDGQMKQQMKAVRFSHLITALQQVGADAKITHDLMRSCTDATLNGADKYLLVKFKAKTEAKRSSWNGATLGNHTMTEFQWNVAYRKEIEHFGRKHVQWHSADPSIHNGKFLGWKPYGSISQSEKELAEFTKIPWTQEREDLLRSIEEKYAKLAEQLNTVLGDISEAGLDQIISNNVKLLE